MEITKESISDQNILINIALKEDDYHPKVEKTLKEYSKKVVMDGFRAGKVPFGVVKKKYGKQVLLEEINDILQDKLKKYISDEKITLLVDPMLKEESISEIDLDDPGDLVFSYEVAIPPSFTIDYSKKRKFTWYRIEIDDALSDKHVDNFRVRYGKLVDGDTIDDDGFIEAELQELTSERLILIGGISNAIKFPIAGLKDDAQKERFKGLKKEESIEVNISDVFNKTEEQLATEILNTTLEKLNQSTKRFKLTVKNLLKLEKAPLDNELYDKILGKGLSNDSESFRKKYKEKLKVHYDRITQQKLHFEILHQFVHEVDLPLPDDYLKRWLVKNTNQELSAVDIESYYHEYVHSLRDRLIKEKVLKDQDIKIEFEDLKVSMEEYINENFAHLYENGKIPDADMAKFKDNLMQDQQFINNATETMVMIKQLEYFHTTFDINDESITLDSYLEMDKKDHEH